MNAATLALQHAEVQLVQRLQQLAGRLRAGDEAAWSAYCEAAAALATIARETAPGAHGQLLTTAQLAAQLGVSSRTVRRRRKAGQLEAVQLGDRGRAALRWRPA